YPLTAGPLPADGRPHRLVLSLGRGGLFPVPPVAIAAGYTHPLPPPAPPRAAARPHRLVLSLGRGALFPVRLVAIAAGYTIPLRPLAHDATFTLTGTGLRGWS